MKRVEILNDNYNALGFGDTLNKLSYLYRKYENVDVEFLFHSKRKVFDTLIFLKEFCFEEPPFKKILIDSEHFLRSKKDFKLINHDYWPTKIKWNANQSDLIATNFYTKMCSWMFHFEWDREIEASKLFLNSLDIKHKYNTVELFGIDDARGHKKVNTDMLECLELNMNILKESRLFVTSEGGMSHLSRSMKVPTIIFFKKDKFNFHIFLQDLIDKNLQKIVHTKEELIDSINYYLKYDKFN